MFIEMDDSAVLITPTKKKNYGCASHTVVAICALILGVIISVSVIQRKTSCIHVHSELFGYFLEPPPHKDSARLARFLVHTTGWCSLSTISSHQDIEGYPFVNVFSYSDGTHRNSSGIPYFYTTDLDLSMLDLNKDKRASITITEAQSGYCKKKNFDPQSPLCARVILTGNISKVEVGSLEEEFAKEALFTRHPEMANWPEDHQFYFAKLNISHIYILDHFGGAKVIPLDEYFASPPQKIHQFLKHT